MINKPKHTYVVKLRSTGEIIGNPTSDPEEARYHFRHYLAFHPKAKEEDLQITKKQV